MNNVERELKLIPAEPGLFDRLASASGLGDFVVQDRRRELQRNAYFDTSSRALEKARVGFRRRLVQGQSLARWTVKAEGEFLRGVATRGEIELQLDADMPPALALGALRQAARQRGAAPLAEQLADALAVGGLPRPDPVLEIETDRTLLDLVMPARGWLVELALDRVRLIGHAYGELEIEAELKRGDEAALEAARAAITALGSVRESKDSKLSRALAHLRACHCVAAQT